MWTPLGLLVVGAVLVTLTKGECQRNEDLYYQEIGCLPQEPDKDGCPTSYDCSSLKARRKDQCHYQGRVYNREQLLEKSPPCLADCRCGRPVDPADAKVSFVCANVECPDLFNGPPREGCYHTYQHDRCCYVKEVCEDNGASKTPVTTCEYAGKTYKLGQKIYPEDNTCTTCICQSGFDGKLVEPFCEKIKCELELHSGDSIVDGCVPIYYGTKGCCPIEWRCPEKTDTVVPMDNKGNVVSSKTPAKMCEFGNLTMQVGDMLSPQKYSKSKCVCKVPPHPSCILEETSS